MKKNGFTLVELLVTLGILCTLAAVALFGTHWTDNLGEQTSDAQQAAALGMLVTQYKLHVGSYPATLDALTSRNAAGYGPYIKSVPKDAYDRAFNYKISSLGFAIWSNGPNGVNDSGDGLSNVKGDDVGIVGF